MIAWWALCKREWLEHRGGFGWAPLVVLALMIIASLLALAFGNFTGASALDPDGNGDIGDLIELAAQNPEATALGLRMMLREIAGPYMLVYFGVAFFVMLGSLFDDRKDRTILFWKSLPVSDTQTVLSKLVTVLWLAPLVTVGVILLAQMFFLTVVSFYVAGSEHMSILGLWGEAALPRSMAEWLFGIFTQSLWHMPIWCWLLLVSAVAPRLPILWALLTPVLPIVLEWAVFSTNHLYSAIANHLQFLALPAYSELESGTTLQNVGFPQMLELWGRIDLWLGLSVAAPLLAAAIYFRRRNNEL